MPDGQCCDALYATAVRDITAVGVLIVAAAGNDGGAVYQPANCPGVLAVAGLRHAGTKVGYSNLGPAVGIARSGRQLRRHRSQDRSLPVCARTR